VRVQVQVRAPVPGWVRALLLLLRHHHRHHRKPTRQQSSPSAPSVPIGG